METGKNIIVSRLQLSVDEMFESLPLDTTAFPFIKKLSFSKTLQSLSQLHPAHRDPQCILENTAANSSAALKYIHSVYKLDKHSLVTSELIEACKLFNRNKAFSSTKEGEAATKERFKLNASYSSAPLGKRCRLKGLTATVIGTRIQPLDVPQCEITDKPRKLSPCKPVPRSVSVVSFKMKNKIQHSNNRPLKLVPTEVRGAVYLDFLENLRKSNGVRLGHSGLRYFKVYIAPGNNSGLVKRALKKRWWWVSTDSMKESNLIWTSVKNRKAFNKLPTGRSIKLELGEVPSKRVHPQGRVFCEEQRGLGYRLVLNSAPFNVLSPISEELVSAEAKIYSRLQGNKHLCNKKHLFKNLRSFYEDQGEDVFSVIPLTFHVSKGKSDPSFTEFEEYYLQHMDSGKNLWIVKPGERSNCGRGIKITSSFNEIRAIVCYPSYHTHIIQKYIENPLLIDNRKFDIRCYGLLTCVNGHMQGYYYQEGYIRTSSSEYSLDSHSKYVHLTNDAVQKHSEYYGKFESGNKLSYADLREYCVRTRIDLDFDRKIAPQIKKIVADTFRSVQSKIDPARKLHCFELMGYDFMIDVNHRVWLIEVNTNPCLEENCSLLSKLLPALLDNTFRLAVDPLFPPPLRSKKLSNWANENAIDNKFELVFSESQSLRPLD